MCCADTLDLDTTVVMGFFKVTAHHFCVNQTWSRHPRALYIKPTIQQSFWRGDSSRGHSIARDTVRRGNIVLQLSPFGIHYQYADLSSGISTQRDHGKVPRLQEDADVVWASSILCVSLHV